MRKSVLLSIFLFVLGTGMCVSAGAQEPNSETVIIGRALYVQKHIVYNDILFDQALPNPTVKLVSGTMEQTIIGEDDGSFEIHGLNPGPATILVEHNGFQAFSSEIIVNEGVNVVLVEMRTEGADPVPGVDVEGDVWTVKAAMLSISNKDKYVETLRDFPGVEIGEREIRIPGNGIRRSYEGGVLSLSLLP